MDKFEIEFLKELREKRTTYASMIDFCCDSLILNNSILEELNKNFYFDSYCGQDYYIDDDGEEVYFDIYQYYIISEYDAERLAKYTNEIVIYNEQLDLYLLCVTHLGTLWTSVEPNWKELEEENEEDGEKE